uniref:Uncharacterized protein n=1 Tax=Dulem virus 42 TaxID=3145760 RepID=A0AAU8B7U8_9CAUD
MDYLNDIPTKVVESNTKMADVIKLYNNMDGELLYNESVLNFFSRNRMYENALQSNALRIGNLEISKQAERKDKYSYQEIYDMLHTRLKALSSTSGIELSERTRLISETQLQMQAFANDFTSKIFAINELLNAVKPQLVKDMKELTDRYNNNDDISGEEYMYHAHANIGMYERLTTTLIMLLKDNQNVS